MLESNTKENRIIFVLERLDKDRLYNQFNDLKVGFNCSFHDSELGKILKPSDIELSDFVKGMTEKYYHRVEARLSCHIYHEYKYFDTSNGYLPEFRHLNYYHFYHGDCLEYWKNFKFQQNDGIAKSINCFLYKSIVIERYDNLYNYE